MLREIIIGAGIGYIFIHLLAWGIFGLLSLMVWETEMWEKWETRKKARLQSRQESQTPSAWPHLKSPTSVV